MEYTEVRQSAQVGDAKHCQDGGGGRKAGMGGGQNGQQDGLGKRAAKGRVKLGCK